MENKVFLSIFVGSMALAMLQKNIYPGRDSVIKVSVLYKSQSFDFGVYVLFCF